MFKFTTLRGRCSVLRFVLLALVLLALVHLHFSLPPGAKLYRPKWSWIPRFSSSRFFHKNGYFNQACDALPGADRIVITVKTGATEAFEKVPVQMLTSLLCAPNVYVFSDMAQKIGDIQIYDALDTIPSSVTDGNTDFDIYRMQQKLQDHPEKIASVLRGMRDPRRPDDLAAWTLDKYKNLHIIEKTWALQPDMDWYLHIDADTYVVWPSLIEWLQRLDPSKDAFLGSLSLINDLPFAHGGSGILLSGVAMRNFLVTHNGTIERWDPKVHDNCCGDWILAQALKECGTDVMNSWPTINGEPPSTIPFDNDHWCQPVVTMHHVSPVEAQQLGNFEQQRLNKSKPLIYSELFMSFFADNIPEQMEDWDNTSGDATVLHIHSAEECAKACAKKEDCFQSLYNGEECTLGTKSIVFGKKREPEGGKKWQSSWNTTRIKEWIANQESCDALKFPYQD